MVVILSHIKSQGFSDVDTLRVGIGKLLNLLLGVKIYAVRSYMKVIVEERERSAIL